MQQAARAPRLRGMELYIFFPIAITAVVVILAVVTTLVVTENASQRRQKTWADSYFELQDARYARRGAADREAVLTAANQREM
jgi:hypothetical protein